MDDPVKLLTNLTPKQTKCERKNNNNHRKVYKEKRSGNGNCSFKCLFGLKDLARGSMDKEKQTDRDERYLTVMKWKRF